MSDLMPSHRFPHSFFDRNNSPLLGARDENTWGEFALRAVCQLSCTLSGQKDVICKYTILLFPASAEELGNTAESRFAGFPGLKIAERYFPPRWQCPIVPMIWPCTPFMDNENAPSGCCMRWRL